MLFLHWPASSCYIWIDCTEHAIHMLSTCSLGSLQSWLVQVCTLTERWWVVRNCKVSSARLGLVSCYLLPVLLYTPSCTPFSRPLFSYLKALDQIIMLTSLAFLYRIPTCYCYLFKIMVIYYKKQNQKNAPKQNLTVKQVRHSQVVMRKNYI